MGFAHYISLEDETMDVVSEVDGKSVARAIEELGQMCKELSVPELDSFLGQSLDEISDLMGNEITPEEGVDPSAKWFEANEGLVVVEALLTALSSNPRRLKGTKGVVADLEGYKSILTRAREAKVRWHLAMDF